MLRAAEHHIRADRWLAFARRGCSTWAFGGTLRWQIWWASSDFATARRRGAW